MRCTIEIQVFDNNKFRQFKWLENEWFTQIHFGNQHVKVMKQNARVLIISNLV